MKNQNSTLQRPRKHRNFSRIKLVLKTPKQNFFESILQNKANAMKVDLKIVDKLKGGKSDRIDLYLVEVSGTFDDLFFTIDCWQELGVEQYLANSSQPLLEYTK